MRGAALVVAIAAYLLAVLAFRPHPTPGPVARDFEAYYAAGAAWDRGADPYGTAIWTYERTVPGVDANRERLLPFVNPPLVLPLMGALARLPYGPAAALWEALLLLALALLLAIALALARTRGWLAAVAAIPLALAFGPVSSDLALGQIALVAVAGLAVAAYGFLAERQLPAGIGAFVAALQPTLALPALAFARSARALHTLLAAATLFALAWFALAAATGAAAPLPYLALLAAHGAAERFAAIQFAPAAIAYGYGANSAAAGAIGIAIASLALCAWCAWTARAKPTLLASFLGACALLPFAAPFFHEHDFALLFLPAVVAVVAGRDAAGRALAVGGTLLCAIDWLGLAQRPDGAVQGGLLALATLASMVALRDRGIGRSGLAAAAIVAAAFAAAAVIAHGHPAPVWPDAMGRLALPPGATPAQIWHEQQRATGMFVPDAFVAALRAMPLIGCAAIAAAIARLPRSSSVPRSP